MSARRLVVGISGSSGVILGIRLLQALRDSDVETHLVVTPAARLTIEQETDWQVDEVQALAHTSYNPRDIGAAIASGSFPTLGMVVIPCSIKSLSAIANSYSADLLTRAADVTLKEGRPLLLVVRETPLHRGHLRQMERAAAAGAVIFPPVPAFYTHPQTIDQMVDNLVGRVLARLGLENELYQPWQGVKPPSEDGWPPANLLALPAMTLATRGVDGEPHAAPVYFAAQAGGPFYFFSDPSSQHCQDLATDSRAAAALHPLVAGWQDIRGLQMRGEAHAVAPGAEWEHAWQLYQEKFPFVNKLKEAVTTSQLYAFTPRWIRLVDNRRGFGYKEERESSL